MYLCSNAALEFVMLLFTLDELVALKSCHIAAYLDNLAVLQLRHNLTHLDELAALLADLSTDTRCRLYIHVSYNVL